MQAANDSDSRSPIEYRTVSNYKGEFMSTPVNPIPEITVTAHAVRAINPLPVGSSGRRPRGIVQLGPHGSLSTVPGFTSLSVTNNSYYEADTFRLVYSTSALPSANDANWFSEQTEIFAQIYAGFPRDPNNPKASELDDLIYGRIDNIAFDPKCRTITLTGRDLTAVFIDNRVTQTYKEQTSSQIATQLASKHGLDTSNIVATTTKVGQFFNNDQVQIESNRSEWDLLSFLAREEGFVVFVQGDSLFFEPNPLPTQANNPYVIEWQQPTSQNGSPIANVVELSFSRTLTVAKGITVTARSANRNTGHPVVQSYPVTPKSISAGKASPFGPTQPYDYLLAEGLTPFQVAAFAQKTYETIIAHEMNMTAHLPADKLLTVQTPIQVEGTGTQFDQVYFAKQITRDLDSGGYRMTVEAQNTSPDESPDL
jgi:hypothetical protein